MHRVWPSWYPFVPRMVSGSPGNFWFSPPIIKQKISYLNFIWGWEDVSEFSLESIRMNVVTDVLKSVQKKKWLLRGVNLDGDLFFKYSNFVWVQHLLHWNTLNSCNQLFWTMEGVALECTAQINAEVLGWNHVPWFSFPVCLGFFFFSPSYLVLESCCSLICPERVE